MGTYGQFCPIAMAAEIFAERWTPLILRELYCGSRRFNELERGLPRISRTLLVQRLRALERAGVVEHRSAANGRASEYHLTAAGQDLANVVMALGEWGQRWANTELRPTDIDPDLLMWDLRRRLHTDRLPARRVVVRFDFSGACSKSYWLVLEGREASICWGDPGFDVDLLVGVDTLAFHYVWLGRLSLDDAIRKGLLVMEGPSNLVRAFPGWLALSVFSGVRPAAAARSDVGSLRYG